MSYENAPATTMLASDCAVCARPLVDAVSVETGIGPICREKHGYNEAQGREDWAAACAACPDVLSPNDAGKDITARSVVNRLVHEIACAQVGPRVIAAIRAIHALGFTTLAARIADRVGSVHVDAEGETLVVSAPFNPEFNEAIRSVRGARWDRERKVRTVPRAERVSLWAALRKAFPPGTLVVGTKIAVLSA